MSFVVDASVVMAVLHGESGGAAAEPSLFGAAVSTVNLSETVARTVERGTPFDRLRRGLARLALVVHSFDAEAAYATAALRPVTRHLGLSLGDRACLALAQRLGWPVLTADRAWQRLDLGLDIRVIR